jgi:phosphoribosylformylglycinamidine cyclo-ligase
LDLIHFPPSSPSQFPGFCWNRGEVDELEMYKTFNMGMGFIIVLPEQDAQRAADITGGRIVGKITGSGIRVGELEIV